MRAQLALATQPPPVRCHSTRRTFLTVRSQIARVSDSSATRSLCVASSYVAATPAPWNVPASGWHEQASSTTAAGPAADADGCTAAAWQPALSWGADAVNGCAASGYDGSADGRDGRADGSDAPPSPYGAFNGSDERTAAQHANTNAARAV